LLIVTGLAMSLAGFATHVVGGELYYRHLGGDEYEITLIVFRDCGPTNTNGTGFDPAASVGIYLTESGAFYDAMSIGLSQSNVDFVPIELENPCFILPPDVCVERATYTETIELPQTDGGYTLVYQRCCRNPSIVNLDFPEDQGATFTTHIPGSEETEEANSSARFDNFPPVALCQNAEFYFDNGATDEDGDSLVYEFCSPLLGGTPDFPAPAPPQGPPFTDVDFAAPFSYDFPIASDPIFNIDPQTGFLTGTATELGQYVLGICVSEFRDGVLINRTNRDFQFNVTTCDPNIIASVPEQTDFCTGLEITFENNSTNATSFHWDFGVENTDADTSSLSSPSYTFTQQGVYNVMLVANPGWPCADTAYSTFTALPVINPVINYGGYECLNNNDYYDFIAEANASTAATYFWDFGLGSVPQTATVPNPQGIMMNPEAGEMQVTLTVQDNGCEEFDEETIDNPPNPAASIADQETFCNGFIYTFENESNNAESYLWNFGVEGNSDFSTQESPTFEFPAGNIYDITLVASAPFTCADTAIMQIEIFGVIDPEFQDFDVQCLEGNSYDFVGTGATTSTAIYNWQFGNDAIPQSSSQQNPQNIQFSSTGFHTISLTISENGCAETYTDLVQLVDYFISNFDVANSYGCPGLLVQLAGSAQSDVPVYYIWDFGDGTSSFQPNTTHVYEQPGTYDVTVSAFTTVGCVDTVTITFEQAVQIYPFPVPGFTIDPQVMSILEADSYINDVSIGGMECHYIMSDGGESDDCSFLYSWTESGTQTITQYVTSEFGCTSSVTGTVIIEGFTFYAPNSFTPNDDDLNDFWQPEMTGITAYELSIFNRWGEMIFHSTDPKLAWTGEIHDGTHFAPNGVYNYIVIADDLLSQPHHFTGHIVLTR
jgi:gliding motility-associated-like protein